MFPTQAENKTNVPDLITEIAALVQRLWNTSADGKISIDDVYVKSVISALPESWPSVTSTLEPQSQVTRVELKSVLR